MILLDVILVGIGGFIGTLLRMELRDRMNPEEITKFPGGTFAANAFACLLLGVMLQTLDHHSIRLFVISGFIGSLSTYSTFINELASLQTVNWRMAIGYTFASITIGILALICGYNLTP